MEINKVITYSLLAQIRNSGNLINGSIDIFVPIVKYALHRFITEEFQYKGESTNELREWIIKIFGLPFPNPVLTQILQKIGREINSDEEIKLTLNNDGSFWIKNYQFDEFNETIELNRQKIAFVQKCFEDFCSISNIDCTGRTTLFDFIDNNKERLGRYLGSKTKVFSQDFTIEAQFVEFFKKIPDCIDLIRQIYLGSIISCYLEYKVDGKDNDKVELLFDTNFIVSLLDLNTPESTNTCKELLKIASQFGYSFRVMNITLEETTKLLMMRADNYDRALLAKLVNPEDIYFACIRRNISRVDLEKIADGLEKTLTEEFDIQTIPHTDSYQNKARFSSEYTELKKYRHSDFAALHDITAKMYVREKRGKKVKLFEGAKCWFVNNTFNRDLDADSFEYRSQDGYLPETIRADDLLNILWFAKPDLGLSLEDAVIDSGLNSLISYTLNSDLPHSAIIRELDDNIQKYSKDAVISDKDIIKVATRISNKELQGIEELNTLAQKDSQKFIAAIKEESDKQEKEEQERIQRFENLLVKMEEAVSKVPESTAVDIEKRKRMDAINEIRALQRKEVTGKALSRWRTTTWIVFGAVLVVGVIISFFIYQWLEKDIRQVGLFIAPALTLIVEFFVGKCLYGQYYDQDNISKYEDRIVKKMPNNLKNLTDISQLPD